MRSQIVRSAVKQKNQVRIRVSAKPRSGYDKTLILQTLHFTRQEKEIERMPLDFFWRYWAIAKNDGKLGEWGVIRDRLTNRIF